MSPEERAAIKARYSDPASPLRDSAEDVPALLAEVERLGALFDLQKQATVGAQNICMVEQRERELAERALEVAVAERDAAIRRYENFRATYTNERETLANEERDAALADAARLRAALTATLAKWVDMAESGDAGFWDPNEEPHVIAARAALEGK